MGSKRYHFTPLTFEEGEEYPIIGRSPCKAEARSDRYMTDTWSTTDPLKVTCRLCLGFIRLQSKKWHKQASINHERNEAIYAKWRESL